MCVCVAAVPGEIADALGLGALTALLKENGRIRGNVTGDTFRRRVARTLPNNVPRSSKRFLREPGQIALLLAPLLPFVRLFYGKDSIYVRYDDEEILQGEGVSRKTPSCQCCMPWASTLL